MLTRLLLIGSFLLLSHMPMSAGEDEPRAGDDLHSEPALTIREEPHRGATRFRVATPEIIILEEDKRSLVLRVEGVHPAESREPPDQFVVYLVSRSRQRRYKQHDTAFLALADGLKVADGPFKSYKVLKEGKDTFEPLISLWTWEEATAITNARELSFTLDGETFSVNAESLDPVRELLGYFAAGASN